LPFLSWCAPAQASRPRPDNVAQTGAPIQCQIDSSGVALQRPVQKPSNRNGRSVEVRVQRPLPVMQSLLLDETAPMPATGEVGGHPIRGPVPREINALARGWTQHQVDRALAEHLIRDPIPAQGSEPSLRNRSATTNTHCYRPCYERPNRRSVCRAPRAHMCRYGAPGGAHLVTFCACVRCAEVELGRHIGGH
jgi:hypothetical protein